VRGSPRPMRQIRLRLLLRLSPLLLLLLFTAFPACSLDGSSGGGDSKTLAIVTLFPTTGPDAAVGLALQQAVALAVKPNGSLTNGYKLIAQNIDEASPLREGSLATALSNPQLVGVIGPYSSETAVALLPEIAVAGVATISPTATLTGLTQSAAADAEGVPFSKLHPQGKPLSFFRLAPTDDALGKAAADEAVGPASAKGLAAQSVFLVDDATLSGKAAAAAFAKELKAKGGTVAGQQSLTTGVNDNAQLVVNAIVGANPDLVFYAGGLAAGAELRGTLSVGGAPGVPILAAGPVADNPGFSAAVGQPILAANTTGLLPASDLTKLDSAKSFLSAWQEAYNKAAPPQSALAYDAALAEIAAIKAVIASGKPVTRSAIATALAASKFDGATGPIAFDEHGDSTAAPAFSVYSCDAKGAWSYQTTLHG
jgi:branched-chain amino acid transport system substrate-binding protein